MVFFYDLILTAHCSMGMIGASCVCHTLWNEEDVFWTTNQPLMQTLSETCHRLMSQIRSHFQWL